MNYTPIAFKEAYTAKMPQAELAVIPNSRHLTPIEKPALFNETLLKFLKKQACVK